MQTAENRVHKKNYTFFNIPWLIINLSVCLVFMRFFNYKNFIILRKMLLLDKITLDKNLAYFFAEKFENGRKKHKAFLSVFDFNVTKLINFVSK